MAEAVALAGATPSLGIGPHLTLLRGHCAAPPAEIPVLVDADGRFSGNPVCGPACALFHPGRPRPAASRKLFEAAAFGGLARWATPRLVTAGLRMPDRMFSMHRRGQ